MPTSTRWSDSTDPRGATLGHGGQHSLVAPSSTSAATRRGVFLWSPDDGPATRQLERHTRQGSLILFLIAALFVTRPMVRASDLPHRALALAIVIALVLVALSRFAGWLGTSIVLALVATTALQCFPISMERDVAFGRDWCWGRWPPGCAHRQR